MAKTTLMADKPKIPSYLAAANLIQEPLIENHNVERTGRLFLVEGPPQEDRFALSRKVDDLLTDVCITDALASYPLLGGRFLIVYPPLTVATEQGELYMLMAGSWSRH